MFSQVELLVIIASQLTLDTNTDTFKCLQENAKI